MGLILGHLNRYMRQARTFYADATGGSDGNSGNAPNNAIQTTTAINALALTLKAGDRLLSKCGETFSAARLELYCAGIPGRPILFGSYGAGAKPIFTRASGNVFKQFAGSRYVVLNNLAFVGTGTASEIAQFYGGYIWVIDCNATGGSSTGHTGFKVYGTAGGANDRGYYFIRCSSYSNKGSGFNPSGGSIGGLYDVLMDTCLAYSNGLAAGEGDHGIYFGRVLSGVIKDCTCYSNLNKGIMVRDSCTNVLVERNRCYSNGEPGIHVDAAAVGSNIQLRNNLLYSNGTNGITISTGGNSVLVYQNTCVNNVNYGIQFEDATTQGCIVKNNLLQQDTAVVAPNMVPIKIRANNELNNTFDRNLYFFDGDAGAHVGTRDATLKDMAEWQALGIDANSVNADAVFVTEFTNLHLQVTSPAIGAGEAGLAVPNDFDQVVRGSPPDIGAYQYV